MDLYKQNENKSKYNIICFSKSDTFSTSWSIIDLFCEYVKHATVKRTSLNPAIHVTVKGIEEN